jgi:hypothetical protein
MSVSSGNDTVCIKCRNVLPDDGRVCPVCHSTVLPLASKLVSTARGRRLAQLDHWYATVWSTVVRIETDGGDLHSFLADLLGNVAEERALEVERRLREQMDRPLSIFELVDGQPLLIGQRQDEWQANCKCNKPVMTGPCLQCEQLRQADTRPAQVGVTNYDGPQEHWFRKPLIKKPSDHVLRAQPLDGCLCTHCEQMRADELPPL